MKRILAFATLLWAFAAFPAHAEIHVQLGGGLEIPNGDSARFLNTGYRVSGGLEWKSGQVGLLLDGSYNRNTVNSAESEKAFRENNPSFPAAAPFSADGVVQVYELSLSPKFYLLDTDDLGAFVIAGGGPRWIRKRVTFDLPDPRPDVHAEKSETSAGLLAGFGVEAAFPGGLSIGLSPAYHFVFAKHRVQYATLTAYLKL